ncbi:5-methylcytosine-specific restriction endonuclease system specificity protein McrC [Urinicoccus timonensis]|uniref:5-methylcytosine-specific restriction endonuclease system specificity protein McrC n=1 Tax=Urinicoccus timonensis TaxID=2024205 RepID=UPI000C07AE43|nr:5-methylcytosine-specific restriction endonuclease system specificity protein McrC [Urinicoccus timonensis]
MIPVQNVYYMLSYAFKALNQQGYKKIATEEFKNTAELMAAILAKGIASQLKQGLKKDYIAQTEELSAIRGKIDITQSLKTNSMLRKRLVCSYDDFSENNTMNRIIKSTAQLLLKADISKTRKKELRKLMVYFTNVRPINLYRVNWNLQYNQNNQTYQMLISLCYLIVKGLLHTNTNGTSKLMDFLDEQRMYRLYEKFILEYYKRHYPDLSASASQIPWSLDDGVDHMLPIMQSDIHLERGNTVLIIDAKYYKRSTQTQFNKHTLHSNNLYQIFTYVKNRQYQFGDEENTVSGMLLYAKTDVSIQPDNVYQMHGNQISAKTLDLNLPFEEVANQLDRIVESHFTDINKVY